MTAEKKVIEKTSKLEAKIIEKEHEAINAEFKKAMDIINRVMSTYGKEFEAHEEFKLSIFRITYKSGKDVLKNAELKIQDMPESFLNTVAERSISDFMDNIELLNDITSSL